MNNFVFYALPTGAEIAGKCVFWAWLRLDRSIFWVVPGGASLIVFAIVLTRVDVSLAGRAFAAFGGVYIVGSLLWLWTVEGARPDRWDTIGGAICLLGAAIILYGPRDLGA